MRLRLSRDDIRDAYLTLDSTWCCTKVTANAAELLFRDAADLLGHCIWNEFPASVGDSLLHSAELAMERQQPVTLETHWTLGNRWIESSIYPSPGEVRITFLDVSDRRRIERLNEGHREVLTGIAAHHPLTESLERIVQLHEELNPGALCSVLLLDSQGERMLFGAAPSLPRAYNLAIHGVPIGEGQGSCGTAIWRRERVIVADIATHPLWVNYRDLALEHGLKACWSTPVLGSDGQAHGTFAVYYREAREPRIDELDSIDKMLTITAIAIESARLIERVQERDGFFELSQEIYCVYDARTERIIQANPTFTRITGYSESELASANIQDFIYPDDLAITNAAAAALRVAGGQVRELVHRFRCKDGSYRWLSWQSVVGGDGKAFGVAQDVTDRRQVETDLAHSASHDAVTLLPHRIVFEKALATLLLEASHPVWVLLIGLDRFQAVNEFMGHFIGDDVLQRVALRLRETVADSGQVARFAGDEFVVALATADHTAVLALAERLRAAVAQVIDNSDYRLALTASVGISRSPDHGMTPKDLLSRAEAAMVRAKRQGKDGVCEFSVKQMEDTESRLVLGRSLRGAVERGEMELHYQPQRDAAKRMLTGFEALLRWVSPELGRIAPARFIPIAETLGMMPEIGEWVINAVCAQARTWLDRGHHGFNIAINVSAQQLQRPGLVAQVRNALQRHDLPIDVLSIELTESSLMENVARVRSTLSELKALGIKLSLDDFGTGYSSLAYLKHFPIDMLKIDQSFVRGLPDNADDAAIARTIVAMGHQLRMVVAAEGVETEAQAMFLLSIGCDELQGYHLGRPQPAEVAEAQFPAAPESFH